MTFFFDNNFSTRLVTVLQIMLVDARHLKQEFPAGEGDIVWIPRIGMNGWILVSADRRIRRNPAERHALQKANIIAYFVHRYFPQQNAWDQLKWLVTHWQGLQSHAMTQAARGCSYEVARDGGIRLLP